MKKYIVYEWSYDNISGYGIAIKGEKAHYPVAPFSSKALIGEFDTIEELIQLIYNCDPDYYDGDIESAKEEVMEMFSNKSLTWSRTYELF